MIINPIRLVTVHFVDGSTYEVENKFEDVVNQVNNEKNLLVNLNLPNGKKIAAMRNTISRIITA